MTDALSGLVRSNFCQYDPSNMFVWAVDMVFSQVADNPNEKQRKEIKDELYRLYFEESCDFAESFLDHYGSRYDFLPKNAEELDWEKTYTH